MLAPAQLRFHYNNHGKPYLKNTSESTGIRFNLSHSEGLILYAVTQDRELGVDVEYLNRNVDYEEIAEHIFSPSEKYALMNCPASERSIGFYRTWVRREAYAKALGVGLSASLPEFGVSLSSGRMMRLLTEESNNHKMFEWSLVDLYPDPSYVAALVGQGSDWSVCYWDNESGTE